MGQFNPHQQHFALWSILGFKKYDSTICSKYIENAEKNETDQQNRHYSGTVSHAESKRGDNTLWNCMYASHWDRSNEFKSQVVVSQVVKKVFWHTLCCHHQVATGDFLWSPFF